MISIKWNFFGILSIFLFTCLIFRNVDGLIVAPPGSRIIEGNETFPGDLPYQIQVLSTKIPDFLCTGVLIHPEWFLTNDACVFRDESDYPEGLYPLIAVAGSYHQLLPELNWQIREFHRNETYLHHHPEFQPPHTHDMFLVHIYPPFISNDFVQPIQIPENPDYYPIGIGTISGWGIHDFMDGAFSPWLREAQVPIQTKEDCENFYGDQELAPDFEYNICAGDPTSAVGACNGDVGAPLTYFDQIENVNYLVGVFSNWKVTGLPVNCIPPNRPDFYTRVPKYGEWIASVIGNNTEVTTTTTETPPGDITCKSVDGRGIYWEGSANTVVIKDCPGEREGQMSWTCLGNGRFNGTNPTYDCNSNWIYYLDQFKISVDFYRDLLETDANSEEFMSLLVEKFSSSLELAIEDPNLNNSAQFFGPEIPQILTLLGNSIGYSTCTPIQNDDDLNRRIENQTRYEINTLGSLFRIQDPWNDLEDQEIKSKYSTEIEQLMKKSSFDVVSRITEDFLQVSPSIIVDFEGGNSTRFYKLMTGIEHMDYVSNLPLRFPRGVDIRTESYIELPPNWKSFLNFKFGAKTEKNDKDLCNLNQGVKFTGVQLESILGKEKFGENLMNNADYHFLNGDILAFSVDTLGNEELDRNTPLIGGTIKIKFKLDTPFNKNGYLYRRTEQKCAYWDTDLLAWRTEGCSLNFAESNEEFSVCECDHLTSFAILMGNRIEDDPVLDILTIVLCALSNLAILGTIFILQNDKNSPGSLPPMQCIILTNICICLFIGNIFFIFLHPTYFRDELSWKLCMTIGILSQYIYTALFTWMGIFGWHVYRLIIYVFNISGSYKIAYHVVGYGFPVLLVGLIAAVGQKDAYYDADYPEFCWLQGDWIWTFLAPVILTSILNIAVLAITLKKLMSFDLKNDIGRASQAKMQRPNIRGFIFLSVILGVTWIPGFLYIFDRESDTLAKISAYMFTVLNASQGIFIFGLQYSLRLRKIRILKSRSITVSQIYSKDKSKSQFVSTSSGKY